MMHAHLHSSMCSAASVSCVLRHATDRCVVSLPDVYVTAPLFM